MLPSAPRPCRKFNSETAHPLPADAGGGSNIRGTATDTMASPIKVRDAHRQLLKAGAIIIPGGKHHKVTHPAVAQTFHLPTHGSKGRPTLSPGMTHEFHKFHALLLAAKSAA